MLPLESCSPQGAGAASRGAHGGPVLTPQACPQASMGGHLGLLGTTTGLWPMRQGALLPGAQEPGVQRVPVHAGHTLRGGGFRAPPRWPRHATGQIWAGCRAQEAKGHVGGSRHLRPLPREPCQSQALPSRRLPSECRLGSSPAPGSRNGADVASSVLLARDTERAGGYPGHTAGCGPRGSVQGPGVDLSFGQHHRCWS